MTELVVCHVVRVQRSLHYNWQEIRWFIAVLSNAFDFISQLINGERFTNYVQSRKHDNPTEQKGCRVLVY
jgi:hypothetical protein